MANQLTSPPDILPGQARPDEQDGVNSVLIRAVRKILYPLVRVLLRHGVSYGMFDALVRQSYVDVAWNEFSPQDRKQTVSRVSALTGLSRKEASRLRDAGNDELEAGLTRHNRAMRVISGWMNDNRFLDSDGHPAELPLEGGMATFATLVKLYSGDIPTMAMLTMLEEAGSVHVSDGTVRLVRHAYVPGGASNEKIEIFGTDIAELMTTIDRNMMLERDRRYFQRKVSGRIASGRSEDFHALAAGKAQALLEELDTVLADAETSAGAGDDDRYISLGIYYYVE